MNPDQKIEVEIFNTALAIDSAGDRERYLDEACVGDADRRRRIEAQLRRRNRDFTDQIGESGPLIATHP